MMKQVIGLMAATMAGGVFSLGHPSIKQLAMHGQSSQVSVVDRTFNRRFQQGVTVTTSPLFARRSAYNSSDLLFQWSSIGEDRLLLTTNQSLQQTLKKQGLSLDDRAVVIISGGLEALMTAKKSGSTKSSSLDLVTGNFDLGIFGSSWINGFMSFDYDHSSPQSSVSMSRGFMTIGNLNQTPYFVSFGSMYAPFGLYSSGILSTVNVKTMGRVKAKILNLGYLSGPVHANVFGFHGNAQSTESYSPINEGGAEVGVQITGDWSYKLDVGILSNLAESQGLQNAGDASSSGSADYTLAHRVPAVDLAAIIKKNQWSLLLEAVLATKHFSAAVLSIDLPGTLGAKPAALHAELQYAFHLGDKPAHTGVSYGRTWDAAALYLPHTSWTVFMTANLLKDAFFGIEYRYDRAYDSPGTLTNTSGALRPSGGAVTVKAGIYF